MNTFGLFETIWQDTRYALRMMRKSPAFAAIAILIVALAIAGNTAMFTVIHAVLLQPLQYRDADRLVHISGGATPSRFAEMEAEAHSFTDLGAFTNQENLTVAASFLRIIGVHHIL